MLAEGGDRGTNIGALDANLYLPGEWLKSLVNFMSAALTSWRDDPRRPAETGETKLTAQLCAHLNSACRHSNWDHFQFKREEPDEMHAARAIDLAIAPRGSVIWLGGRAYSEYQTLLPIECKRLPTPAGSDRDEREYLFSRFNSSGGVQRFKLGLHGGNHPRAAMIGYVQNRDIDHWQSQVDGWVAGLATVGAAGWAMTDSLVLVTHNRIARSAYLRSGHVRPSPLNPIEIDHLWIEM